MGDTPVLPLVVIDGEGDTLGTVDSIDEIPSWENALQRTAKQIANANYGYITDKFGMVVYDSQEELD